MKKLLFLMLFVFATSSICKSQDFWAAEFSANVSYYNSLSFSLEKNFTVGRFTFGPRAEYVRPLKSLSYDVGDTSYIMESQFRLRLVQVEFQLNDRVSIGVSPFWLLGPIPRNGYYKTPSTFYAEIKLKNGVFLETSFTTSDNEFIQMSLRKRL